MKKGKSGCFIRTENFTDKRQQGSLKIDLPAMRRAAAHANSLWSCCKTRHFILNSKHMDDKNFINQLKSHQRELHQLMHRRLPVLIGRMAKDHFQNNFRLQGFLNNGLTRWQETRRQQSGGKGASSQFPSFYDTPSLTLH